MAGDNRKDKLREAAIDRAEELFLLLVGQPNNQRDKTWRLGSKGSFAMEMRGPKRGVWHDHESGAAGDLFDLVAIHDMGLSSAKADFPAVLKRIEALLGMPDLETYDPAEIDRRRKAREADQRAEDQESIEVVRAVQNAAQPLAESPAEAYLRRRGITRMPPGWSFAPPLKPRKRLMHPHRAALVAWALDDSGTVKGGARVLVMPDGSKAPEDARKPTFGSIGGFPARLPADTPDGPLFVAEGPETALTVWQATRCETWATCGASNFESAPVPTGRTVIFCPDADAPDSPAGQSFLRACRHHVARGVNLYIAQPGQEPGSRQDLNDTLRERGEDAVKALLEAAKPFRDPDALPTVAEARTTLSGAVGAFYAAVEEWHGRDWWSEAVDMVAETSAPAHLLAAGLGLGKTTSTTRAMVTRLRQLRAEGNVSAAAVMLVPMHKLGEQIAAELRQMAPELTVAVIRGAEAEDPDQPGTTVCKRLEDYRDRQRHLLDPCAGCTLVDSCIMQKGRKTVADIYLQAHGALGGRPAPVAERRKQSLDHVVIDESPLSALLVGVEAPRLLGLASWQAARLPASTLDAADLAAWRGRLAKAAEAVQDGPLTRAALLAAGLTANDAKAAAGLEWSRKVEDESSPDLSENLTVARAAGIWNAVAELLAGDIETGGRLHVVADPERGPCIRHRGLRQINGAWQGAPMLALDATADATVAAALLQRPIARTDEIRAAEPMLTIRQDSTFTGSKSLLVASPTVKGQQACRNNRRALETYINRQARKMAPETLLLVGNKSLLEQLDLADNVATAHFNALRGLNAFETVKAAVIVGRPQPDERTLAAMTGAIFGREVEGRINIKGTATRRTTGGMEVMGRASVHDDPDAQRLLHLVRDAEVLQAIGRLRAVNRTDQVEVLLLSDAVLPVPVELAPVWREIRQADPLEQMLLQDGIAFLSPAHAAKAYPTRWKSLNAAKYALSGVTGEKTSLRTLYDEFSPVVVSYRLPRAKEPVVAVIDARRHPVPKASLERILGPLSQFKVLEYIPSPAESAVESTCKHLEYIAKMTGRLPKVTVRDVETSVSVVGQVPAAVMAESLRRRGWPVELVPLKLT